MNEKSEQELNIKLATHLLGIKKIYYSEWDTDKSYPLYIPSGKPWRTHQIDAARVPDFTQSLNACFKLLLPKITQLYGEQIRDKLLHQWIDELKGLPETDPDLSDILLPLCLGIEKLIPNDANKKEK